VNAVLNCARCGSYCIVCVSIIAQNVPALGAGEARIADAVKRGGRF